MEFVLKAGKADRILSKPVREILSSGVIYQAGHSLEDEDWNLLRRWLWHALETAVIVAWNSFESRQKRREQLLKAVTDHAPFFDKDVSLLDLPDGVAHPYVDSPGYESFWSVVPDGKSSKDVVTVEEEDISKDSENSDTD